MTEHHDEATPVDQDAPAAEGSMLASIRNDRKARRNQQRFDRRVPGLPNIYVRFRPINQTKLIASVKAAEKSKNPDAVAIANANVLIDACLGIYELLDGEEVSPDPRDRHGNLPRFDQQLGELIALDGEELTKAVEVCRALYDNDLALAATVDELLEWSRTMNEDLDREHQGN